MKKKTRLKKAEQEELKAMFESGADSSAIQKHFNISEKTFLNYLNKLKSDGKKIFKSKSIVCPFHFERAQKIITCAKEGRQTVNLIFINQKAKADYAESFCKCENFKNCNVYKKMNT